MIAIAGRAIDMTDSPMTPLDVGGASLNSNLLDNPHPSHQISPFSYEFSQETGLRREMTSTNAWQMPRQRFTR